MSSVSLSERLGGSTLKSMVVPATGRSPTQAHIGGLSGVPSMAAANGTHPAGAIEARDLPMPTLAPP